MVTYECISIKQPFADFIMDSKKTIETRSWNTKVRGKVLVHSSKKPDLEACKHFRINPKKLKNGYILGIIEIIDTFKFISKYHFDRLRDKHKSPYQYYDGIYGWEVRNPVKINPVKYKGRLGFFEVSL